VSFDSLGRKLVGDAPPLRPRRASASFWAKAVAMRAPGSVEHPAHGALDAHVGIRDYGRDATQD